MIKLNSKKPKNIQDKIQHGFIKKYAIVAGSIFLVIILWFVIFYNPIKSDISDHTQQVNDWMQKIKMATVSKDAILLLEKNVDTLNVQIEEIEKRIYYLDDMQYIADELIKYARRHQLNIQSMVPNYDVLPRKTSDPESE